MAICIECSGPAVIDAVGGRCSNTARFCRTPFAFAPHDERHAPGALFAFGGYPSAGSDGRACSAILGLFGDGGRVHRLNDGCGALFSDIPLILFCDNVNPSRFGHEPGA
jgi:hypothetical protein